MANNNTTEDDVTASAAPRSGKRELRRHMTELIRLLAIEVALDPETGRWNRAVVRNQIRKAFIARSGGLSEEYFTPLLGAAINEPDPSHCRWFVEPAINAFGRRRVRAQLVRVLQTGSDRERAGSARAWYWTAYPLRQQHLQAGTAGDGSEDEAADIIAAWRAVALREFVGNEDLMVRCSLIAHLPLDPVSYPPELRGLVDTALTIARTHPDEYIRRRVLRRRESM